MGSWVEAPDFLNWLDRLGSPDASSGEGFLAWSLPGLCAVGIVEERLFVLVSAFLLVPLVNLLVTGDTAGRSRWARGGAVLIADKVLRGAALASETGAGRLELLLVVDCCGCCICLSGRARSGFSVSVFAFFRGSVGGGASGSKKAAARLRFSPRPGTYGALVAGRGLHFPGCRTLVAGLSPRLSM
jgi:hypothetical protein